MFGNKSKTVIKHSPILKNWGENVKGKKWETLLENLRVKRARWRNKEVIKRVGLKERDRNRKK